MSKTKSPTALKTVLNGNSLLNRMARHAKKQPTKGRESPLDCLPPALRNRVTLVEDTQRWLAITDTNASAQLLRFHLPKLQKALPGQQVKIVVGGKRKPNDTRAATPRTGPILDKDSAEQIRDLAENIDDTALSESLRRLASRSENNNGGK